MLFTDIKFEYNSQFYITFNTININKIEKIKVTHRIININLLVTLIYIMFMSYNNLYITKYYSKILDILSDSKKINLYDLYDLIFTKYN